uniref:Uncharacterized protein n=1 Tax=Arion vulgaris TaxID=1028688 RepID=A0A0B7AQY9_9EUPU
MACETSRTARIEQKLQTRKAAQLPQVLVILAHIVKEHFNLVSDSIVIYTNKHYATTFPWKNTWSSSSSNGIPHPHQITSPEQNFATPTVLQNFFLS